MRNRIIHERRPSRALVCAVLLACSDDGTTVPVRSTTGAIHVTISATGVDIPATFGVFVSGRSTVIGATIADVTIVGLPPGAHTLRVEAARNCQVAGENPRPVTVAIGDTTSVSFSFTCTAAFGSLRVTTRTTGPDVDPTGYAVRVDGFTLENRPYQDQVVVASTGERTIARVPVGNQRVTLMDLAFNCNSVATNPQTISVAPGETAPIAFDVVCVAGMAQFAYVTGTGATQEIHISNADRTGDRAITANGFADTDPAWSPDGERLAFTSERDGNREIYVVNADGSNSVRLTDSPSEDYRPAWAPDGARLAFVSTRLGNADIFVMNSDGTNIVRLTTQSANTDPAWSPDGRSIAFTSERDGRPEVYVMDAAGAAVTRVTTEGGRHPAWSPDGTSLAFVSPACPGYPFSCQPSIYVKVGTQAARRIVAEIGERPAWSPDGRRIAFNALLCDFYYIDCRPNGVAIAMADGTDVIRTALGHSAVWRPRLRL